MPIYDEEEYLDDLEDAAENVIIAYNIGASLHGSLKMLAENLNMELRAEDDDVKPIEELHETLRSLFQEKTNSFKKLKTVADNLYEAADALQKNFDKDNVENLKKALFAYASINVETDDADATSH